MTKLPEDVRSDPDFPWVKRDISDEVLEGWEEELRTWARSWLTYGGYIAWRLGITTDEAIQLTTAHSIQTMSTAIDSLVDSYNAHAKATAELTEVNAALHEQRVVEHEEWRERNAIAVEQQKRAIAIQEKLLPLAEREVDDMKEGESWRAGEEDD